ncbi:MAG TPA: hypothetical protein VGI14_09280 [Casimicrobiaceae bacterium]|jgi:hypothetical protein
MDWLDNPAVQGGIAPLVVGLVVGAALASTHRLGRTPLAWLGVTAAYAVTTYLATGLQLTPLTASRKVMLVTVAGALIGLALDLGARRSAGLAALCLVAAACATVWAFWSIVAQREGAASFGLAIGIASFAAVTVWLILSLADDGMRAAATGVGFGVATGVSAVVSASIGFLLSGMAIAASCGALLIVQVLARRDMPARFVAALSVGLPCALFAVGAMLLAQMPWFVLPLLLLVPLALALIPLRALPPMARAAALVAVALVVAVVPVAAAWLAARAS